MNLVQLLQNIGCKNARNDGMDRISSLRDGRWVEMFAEMGYDRGEFIFPDGGHSSFFLVLPDGNIASADNVMCGNGFYAIANELGIDADAVLGKEPYGEFIMYTDEDGIEDEDTAISIWTPEEFQIKLQQCQQLVNKQVNESKNMNRKNTIRLTESELKRVITESVKNIISELDWKTYANAHKKAIDNRDYKRADRFQDAAVDKYNDEYGFNDNEGDFCMIDSQHADGLGCEWVHYPNGDRKLFHDGYHEFDEFSSPAKLKQRKRNLPQRVKKAEKEFANYSRGNYTYSKSKGWHLKDGRK